MPVKIPDITRRGFLLLSFLAFTILTFAQQKSAYVLYDKKGKKISYEKMLKTLVKQDIVLFGEFHNNPISHWLQLEVTRDCDPARDLILGAEMFERDNADALASYLKGALSAKGLDSNARLWKNYNTDYAPLVTYAKENNIEFVATNVPRRYASMVARGGFEALDTVSVNQKTWIAPLPILYDPELPGYKKMKEMMPGHGGENLPKAQALKDATMAFFIDQAYKPGSLFIHYNGAYHSDNFEGILWYLLQKRPDLKYSTITTVSQENVFKLEKEHLGKADFIICVDADMTTTY